MDIMKISRRNFLKTLSVSLAIPFVPNIGTSNLSVPEPKWIIQPENFDRNLAVIAKWNNKIKRAAMIEMPIPKDMEESIMYCKQALRKWYCVNYIDGHRHELSGEL